MASQMPDASVVRTTVEITGRGDGRRAVRVRRDRQGDRVRRVPARVRGRQRRPGGRARGPGEPAAAAAARAIVVGAADAARHGSRSRSGARSRWATTRSRPPRYTEASLIKELEEGGHRSPVHLRADDRDDHQRRGYVFRQRKALRAELHGVRGRPSCCAITSATTSTSGSRPKWRRILDEISNGERDWLQFLRQFFGGAATGSTRPRAEGRGASRTRWAIRPSDIGTDPETGQPIRRADRAVRAVPAARRRRRRATRRRCPTIWRRPSSRWSGRGTAQGQGRRGRARSARTRSRACPCTCNTGRFGPYVQLGEAPPRGAARAEAAAGLAAVVAARGHRSRSSEALRLLELPRDVGHHPTTASRSSPAPAGSGPT